MRFYILFSLIVLTICSFLLSFSILYVILRTSQKKELMTYALYDYRQKY